MSENMNNQFNYDTQNEAINDREQPWRKRGIKKRKTIFDFFSFRNLILFGVALVFFIVIIANLSGGNKSVDNENLRYITNKINKLESGMSHLAEMEERLILLEKINGDFQTVVGENNKSMRSINEKIDFLLNEFSSLREKANAVSKLTESTSLKDNEKAAVRASAHRYHTVRPGENLFRIARLYGLSLDQICTLNHITNKNIIRTGQKLIVGNVSN